MLRLEVKGVTEIRASVADFIEAMQDMTALWERYGEIMSTTEADWFESEGGGTWPPLAKSTLEYKERRGWSPEPVRRSDLLMQSLVDPVEAMDISQGRSTLGTFTRRAMTWGTDVTEAEEFVALGLNVAGRDKEYAHYHQGTDPVTGEPVDYGGDPPERQVIPWPLPIQTQNAMLHAAEDWVDDVLRESGLAA